MKRIWVVMALVALTIAVVSSQPDPQAAQGVKPGSGESVQDLKAKIQMLEARILVLQTRINSLESRKCHSVPIAPRESPMPPGSTPFYFNGMQFWHLPVQDNAVPGK